MKITLVLGEVRRYRELFHLKKKKKKMGESGKVGKCLNYETEMDAQNMYRCGQYPGERNRNSQGL